MKTRMKRPFRALVIGWCAFGAAAAAGKSGAQWHVDAGYSRSDRHEYRDDRVTFIVNGERFLLDGHALACEIAEVLRCKGYHISIAGDCVTVRFRGHAPRVSLAGCAYDLEVSRSRGCLVIRPYLIQRRSFDQGWQSGGSWNHRSRGYDYHWPSRIRTGWTVRAGSSCR